MFVEEKEFVDYIEHIKVEVDKRTNHHVFFEEYVIVPFFGFIILRFNLVGNNISLDALDKYETQLYEIVGDNYLVDFMGSIYRKVGVDFTKLSNALKQLREKLKDESVDFNPSYKTKIQEDAEELLKRAGLNTNQKVWEIQKEEDEINLFILGQDNRLIKTIQDGSTINVYETSEEECVGLVRAVFYAKRNKISLARLLN